MSIEEAIEDVKGLSPSEDAILTLLINYRNKEADLYEANKRIADLLLILGDRDRMINEILKTWKQDDVRSIEELREYFEKKVKE